ncbi:uncharacterized protein LOC118740100 [Rhagoletis pomonella]|uniref:uncharacterized protein LOC118740100 n=1 Tax=Rhagoletis pomonella TaxID=28610 RepID=UPI001783507A|nr:uncharacterized protein LOC118740100 [Rhagoletis pomonella]
MRADGYIFFFLINSLITGTIALPYQHLVTIDPDVTLVPEETVVATQLQVSPRADGTRDYEFKEVPVILSARNMDLMPAEEEVVEKESVNEKVQENVEMVNGEVKMQTETEKSNEDSLNSAGEAVKTAVNEIDESTKSLQDVAQSPQSIGTAVIKPPKSKRPAIIDSGNPIYITIPIYVNSEPGLPLTLSVGSQEIALKGNNRQRPASRRGVFQNNGSPTSQYNKLL